MNKDKPPYRNTQRRSEGLGTEVLAYRAWLFVALYLVALTTAFLCKWGLLAKFLWSIPTMMLAIGLMLTGVFMVYFSESKPRPITIGGILTILGGILVIIMFHFVK